MDHYEAGNTSLVHVLPKDLGKLDDLADDFGLQLVEGPRFIFDEGSCVEFELGDSDGVAQGPRYLTDELSEILIPGTIVEIRRIWKNGDRFGGASYIVCNGQRTIEGSMDKPAQEAFKRWGIRPNG